MKHLLKRTLVAISLATFNEIGIAQNMGIIMSISDFRYSKNNEPYVSYPLQVIEIPRSSRKVSNGHYQVGVRINKSTKSLITRIGLIRNTYSAFQLGAPSDTRYYTTHISSPTRGFSIGMSYMTQLAMRKKISLFTGFSTDYSQIRNKLTMQSEFFDMNRKKTSSEEDLYSFPQNLNLSLGPVLQVNYSFFKKLYIGIEYKYQLNIDWQRGRLTETATKFDSENRPISTSQFERNLNIKHFQALGRFTVHLGFQI